MTIWAQKGTPGMRRPEPDGSSASVVGDAEFADTDTLQLRRIGTYEDRRTDVRSRGTGVRRPR
ncbi:hypothetical protein GCM10010327_34560 [Streptomyces nitrosporeus]|nr:hypothetical protein GCM10010327_34560 [Streptomyces nitrosporeus]